MPKVQTKQVSASMRKVFSQLTSGKTTAFGYAVGTNGSTYLNGNTVKALIRRGLLEHCGEIPWQTYSTVQALLRAGCIVEERRWMAGEAIQGERTWERWTIRYRLKGKTA